MRVSGLCLLFVLVVTSRLPYAADVSHPNGSVEWQLASVMRAEHDGDLLRALSRARDVVDNHRDHVLAQLIYGRLMVKNGDAGGAIAVLQPLLATSSEDWRVWFWLGSAQLMAGDIDNAAVSLDEALSREAGQAALWVQRAIVEQERDNPRAALHYLQVANSIDVDNLDVLFNFAYATEMSGDWHKAATLYRYFLQHSASSVEYAHLRRQALRRLPVLAAHSPQASAMTADTGSQKAAGADHEVSADDSMLDSEPDW